MAYDPDAVYQQTVADLGLQGAWENAAIAESLGNTKARAEYGEHRITEAEPGTYRSSDNAANRGGILQSGIQARRTSDISNRFAAQRLQNQVNVQQGEASAKRQKESVKLKQEQGEHGAASTREAEKDRIARENPPVLPAQAPAGPGWIGTAGSTFVPTPAEPYPGYKALKSGQVKVKGVKP